MNTVRELGQCVSCIEAMQAKVVEKRHIKV
jgi:hypothetical protein